MDFHGTIAFWLIIITLGFPPPMFPWGTSPKHPNKVHKYVETCHPSITSKSTSPCHLAPMVSSSQDFGFQFNPLTFQLTLQAL